MNVPAPLERLITELSRLPGVGQKTAQRLAFAILRDEGPRVKALAGAIGEVKELGEASSSGRNDRREDV